MEAEAKEKEKFTKLRKMGDLDQQAAEFGAMADSRDARPKNIAQFGRSKSPKAGGSKPLIDVLHESYFQNAELRKSQIEEHKESIYESFSEEIPAHPKTTRADSYRAADTQLLLTPDD